MRYRPSWFLLLSSLLLLTWLPWQVLATPYASCLTNTGSSISFRLNEAADSVNLIYNDGATTLSLGALPAGVFTTNVVVTGLYSIQVTKTTGPGYTDGVLQQISTDANNFVKFWSPRGVAVNTHPASPYFGRVYVANPTSGTTGGRTTGDGLFLLNADLSDAVGQGNTPLSGGIQWTSTYENSSKPWKLEVGEDGNLYIADWTTNTGGIYVVDPDVSPTSGRQLLIGLGSPPPYGPSTSTTHGQVPSSVHAFGSLAAGTLTLYALEGDSSPVNTVRRWNVGAGPLPSDVTNAICSDTAGVLPALLDIRNVYTDMSIGPEGHFYLSQYRSVGNEAGIVVADPAVDLEGGGDFGDEPNGIADIVYNSLAATRALGSPTDVDLLRNTRAVDISPDGTIMAISRHDGPVWIIPLVNYLPDLANRRQINVFPVGNNSSHDVCFDAAGNLYVINNYAELLRVFSPGLYSVATTGSGGTFSVTHGLPPTTIASLTATDANIYERMAAYDTATVTIGRVGDTSSSLTVNLTYAGTAVSGTDYQTPPSTVTIDVGQATANLTLTGIDNSLLEGDKTIIVTLTTGAGYDVSATANQATVTLRDDEQTPGTVVFLDDFETDSSANWSIAFNQATNTADDYTVEFNYDYSLAGIPPAPHSVGGSSRGVRVTVNKDATYGAAAGVNLYPIGPNFSGDFTLRCDAYLSVGSDKGGQTEHSLVGINHSGLIANCHHNATNSVSDGIWFAIDGDGSNNRGYAIYTAPSGGPTQIKNNTPDFAGIFTAPPYGFAGSPNNLTNATTSTSSGTHWADLEVSQIAGVVTFKVNNTTIFTYTNTTAFTGGKIMIGHNDQFNSIGSLNNYTLFDNVRVVSFGAVPINIQTIAVNAGQVTIDFTGDSAAAPASFKLQSSAIVQGPYAETTGVFTERAPAGTGLFRVTTAVDGPTRFYYIERP